MIYSWKNRFLAIILVKKIEKKSKIFIIEISMENIRFCIETTSVMILLRNLAINWRELASFGQKMAKICDYEHFSPKRSNKGQFFWVSWPGYTQNQRFSVSINKEYVLVDWSDQKISFLQKFRWSKFSIFFINLPV